MNRPIVDDQARGLRRMLKREGRTVAVLSGKGGVGKTFVSTSLAVLAARRERVVIVDGDLGLANVDVVLRASTRFTIEDVIAGTCSIEDAIVKGAHGVSVVTAGNTVDSARISDAKRMALAGLITDLQRRFDLVIVDCGAGIGDNVLCLAALADSRLLVLTPEPTSMVDGYATIKALEGDFDVVVNCVTSDVDAKDTYDRLAAVVARFLPSRVTFLGGIPRDDGVRRAVMARSPVVAAEPESRAARALSRVADRLLARGAQ